jgi:hypothetical protein
MFFVQTCTLPPRMHQKLTKHEKFCKQNNQLSTKSHVELKDNSIDLQVSNDPGGPSCAFNKSTLITLMVFES